MQQLEPAAAAAAAAVQVRDNRQLLEVYICLYIPVVAMNKLKAVA